MSISLSTLLLAYYVAIIATFCLYGLHRYWLVWLFLRSGGLDRDDPTPPRRFSTLPRVTVQLPMFNERRVAERVIEAACGLDYPADRLQIQVLDDSTDESADIARRCCERLAAAGHDIEYRHRHRRAGFKAGALADAMPSATGELLAVFDADFVPPADYLRSTVDQFTDESVGMVQVRWEHLNRDESWLTRIQALCLDGHFVVEQTARARTGRWFNFNGTAGIWRRQCIDDAGGWQHDTLTEDTDLSYRAQLAGWTFRYLPGVTCPAELPPTIGALMTQQHRWNKGLTQTAIKLLPTIVRSPASPGRKIEAFFHLTSPIPYAALLLLTLLIVPGFLVELPRTGVHPALALGLGIGALALGTFAAAAFYVVSQAAQRRLRFSLLGQLLTLMAVGVGVSVLNTKAIMEAVLGWQSPFVRTPKFAGGMRSDLDPAARRRRRLPRGLIELTLGVVMLAGVALSATRPFTLVGLPFLVLFAVGYLLVALPQLRPRRFAT
ncbi:MAG: glycosyltransferase [Phycisphaerales bacterium]|nr:glycosyltransferase [Phycisphaerales bacterium]NNM24742.1 glycosyltransferase [Phycisphaerales bacterium]